MTSQFEDERELRLSEYLSSNKPLPKRLSCSLEEAYLHKIGCASSWLGISKTEAIRLAIDQLVNKIDQTRGFKVS